MSTLAGPERRTSSTEGGGHKQDQETASHIFDFPDYVQISRGFGKYRLKCNKFRLKKKNLMSSAYLIFPNECQNFLTSDMILRMGRGTPLLPSLTSTLSIKEVFILAQLEFYLWYP